jgi:hypothetical protein
MIADWTQEERDYLRVEVARSALRTPFRDGTVQDLAKQVGCCWRCRSRVPLLLLLCQKQNGAVGAGSAA